MDAGWMMDAWISFHSAYIVATTFDTTIMMKLYSLAIQLLSTVFTAVVITPSSVSVTEAFAKKHDYRGDDIDINSAAATTSGSHGNLFALRDTVDAVSNSIKSSSSDCPPKPTLGVECGNVYNTSATGEEVVVTLSGNLLCDGNVTEADGTRNAVLTLAGKNAVLDCRGYTISQTTVNINGTDTGTGSAALLDCYVPPAKGSEELMMRREELKKQCGYFYQFGVILEDGAKMKRCNVQKFFTGAGIGNGGGIEDSKFSLNKRGVEISNAADAIVNNVTIANTVARIAKR